MKRVMQIAFSVMLAGAIAAAVQAAPPDGSKPAFEWQTAPPRSPVIANLTWAPKETIVRKAKGGDNWPMTWADDGHLYTAYGDGWGFEPLIAEKLSMGLCRVEGGPDMFRGINLRSPTMERKGEGMKGVKASGMLMVEGVLYVLVRNAENSQLGWSTDHGQTWTWSDWRFTKSMGCPTFLNFGPNYAGARDEYVYVYSLDHNSAYEAADRMILARVPKTGIKDKAAYEFFQSRTASGDAVWTKDFDKRGAVFEHPGKCYRSGVTYNPALKRYLWCQVLPTSTHAQGPRFQGGFGVYDAPQPWGPWTTVYYTDAWDVGPGETSSFPTKWMSPDGKTLHLVFSGDDYFSVRQATLTLHSQPDETGFTPLFDGKSLAGWEGDPKIFRIEDGTIVAGSKTERIVHNEFLASKDQFGDFELRLQARLVGNGQNAGVQFRSQRIPDHFEMIGYQCDMGAMRGQSIWGALYDESRRRKFLVEPPQDALKSAVKSDDWNDLVIRCEGPRIQMWVNGVQTVDYTEADAAIPKTGRFGLQIHGGEPAEASYRNIRIKRLGS